jgi:hypothetical protein
VSRWVQRYRDGQCRQVWTELTSLGVDLRSDRGLLAEATQVIRETMLRARRNIEQLIELLPDAGYEFEAEPLVPPPPDAAAQLDALERDRAVAPCAADLV